MDEKSEFVKERARRETESLRAIFQGIRQGLGVSERLRWREYVQKRMNKDTKPSNLPLNSPHSSSRELPERSLLNRAKEKSFRFSGGKFLTSFREKPVRKSLSGLINSISSKVESPLSNNHPSSNPQRPPSHVPKDVSIPENYLSFELDGRKSRDKEGSISVNE